MSITPDGALRIFTIYSRPDDYPEAPFLVRAFEIRDSAFGSMAAPAEIIGIADTIDDARDLLPPDADARIDRSPDDPPTVVESWL